MCAQAPRSSLCVLARARRVSRRYADPDLEVGRVLPGLGSPTRFTLAEDSPAVGRTLASLNLRGATGATVLAIARGGEGVLCPRATSNSGCTTCSRWQAPRRPWPRPRAALGQRPAGPASS